MSVLRVTHRLWYYIVDYTSAAQITKGVILHLIRSTNTDNLLYRLSKGPGQPMLVDCLTDDADNMLRLVREAPAYGTYIHFPGNLQLPLDNLYSRLSMFSG